MLMGGRVGVDSQPGTGATFWFEAPFEIGADETTIQRDTRFAAGPHAASRRILLVDDDAINTEVADYLLRREGFEVDIACDGLEAVERAACGPYAAVLMDLQMPHMDGLEATHVIRRMPDHASTPIIAMTASVFEEDRRTCFEAGMSDLVAKPIDPAHLSAALARWVPASAGLAALPADRPRPAHVEAVPGQQLLRLQQLVAQDDLEARELFRVLPPEVCGAMHAELRRRLDDFDYDQAAVLIAGRLQELAQEASAGD
jgi:CheY-like chemotaxis protein